tara:strand:+ start:325 stop:1149 length:825 start_codon:yes stop_codon:yes gene_type:complete
MIKHYTFSARWRKKDTEYIETFKTSRKIAQGFCSFYVEEKDYQSIMKYYSKKDSLLNKTKPPEFSVRLVFVSFSKEELDDAKYYMLAATGAPKGYPQPEQGEHLKKTFSFDCGNYRTNRKQIAPFRIKKPKWSKNQVNFSLNWEWDFMFFKKEFYQEVFAPLGIKSKEVLQHSTGKPLEDTVQLDIPVAESSIYLEDSAFDIYEPRCGKKQYARQYLDFFPPFKKEFNFHICYTQEEFDGGFKRIIISKEFCNLLTKHKIIKYISTHLIPMKSK